MEKTMKYVLIGAGPAGVRAAETLRKEDPDGEITLVSGEPGEPYARMAIPYVLSGQIDESGALQRKTELHYNHQGIDYLNRKALKVHARARTAARSIWTTAARLAYDRLLVATGSSPSLPPIARHRPARRA
jgi:NADPH-dependent 2,4-dienoyl-CoA reductase/sulfur reductase-like enzyme